jgi:hypothetical protein
VPGKDSSRKRLKGRRADRADYFETVVPYLSPADADAAFRAWLAGAGIARDALSPRDVMVDERDGAVGRERAYRVYRYAIPGRS